MRSRFVLALAIGALAFAGCGGDDDRAARPDTLPTGDTDITGTSAGYPEPEAKALAKPFAGKPVPAAWLHKWTDAVSGAKWELHATGSPQCRSITAGRTTCFTNGPTGSTATDPTSLYSAGAITHEGGKVVLRMTYTPIAGGVSCFSDDAYRFRFAEQEITIVLDGGDHCFYERAEAEAGARARKIPNDAFTVWKRNE